MTDHKHQPDYAYYRPRPRHSSRPPLTCIHCGKPLYCTNEHLTFFNFLPVVPGVIVFAFNKAAGLLLFIVGFSLFKEPIYRFIFPRLHFEIDNDALRGDMTRYRNRK